MLFEVADEFPTDRERLKKWLLPRTPEELARLERGEKYDDPAVADPFPREVAVFEDRYGSGEWRVEYNDDDGGCYVTVFRGGAAGAGVLCCPEERAATHDPACCRSGPLRSTR